MPDTLVRVDHVSKKFCRDFRKSLWYGAKDLGRELSGMRRETTSLRPEEFWAIKDVSFELARGECIGLVGNNGAGKTTLLRMLNGLIKPDMGTIHIRGRVGALIALGAGFNPILTGRENIYVNAAVLGLSKRETDRRFEEIVNFSELAAFIDSPVQHYSSGMYVRLAFSIAAHLEPDVLLVDEALAVGDLAFVIKCLNRIASLRANGTGVIFVSHSETQIREAAQRCILLDHGRALFSGMPDDALAMQASLLADASAAGDDAGYAYHGVVRLDLETATPVDMIHVGQPFSLGFRVSISESRDDVLFDLRIWNERGELATSLRAMASEFGFEIKPAVARLDIEIPCLSLPPGKYRVAGGFRRHGEVLSWSRDLHRFVVPGNAGHAAFTSSGPSQMLVNMHAGAGDPRRS